MNPTLRGPVPYVWPESGQIGQVGHEPFIQLFEASSAIFGLVSGLTGLGVSWLVYMVRRSSNLQVRIVVSVYPACPTTDQELQELYDLQMTLGDRFKCRILSMGPAALGCGSALVGHARPPAEPLLLLGSAMDLGLAPVRSGQANLLQHIEDELLAHWCRWFDQLWDVSAPLTLDTLAIPALVLASGNPEAARLWSEYEALSAGASPLQTTSITVENADELEPTAVEGGVTTPTKELGIAPPDQLKLQLARLYEAGALVSTVSSTGLPPFVAPIDPRWFGKESLRKNGAMKREIRYSISAFDPEDRNVLENLRKKTTFLLGRLSFPMGDRQRWIPHTAKAILEAEMTRLNEEGLRALGTIVQGDYSGYVNARRESIAADANESYQEFFPEQKLAPDVIDRIVAVLKKRLSGIEGQKLLARVNYATVRPAFSEASDWVAVWDQSLTLLLSIARYPREALVNYRFFWGLRTPTDQILQAMDVCQDAFFQGKRSLKAAEEQLTWLNRIEFDSVDTRTKCLAVMAILHGRTTGDVASILEETRTKQNLPDVKITT